MYAYTAVLHVVKDENYDAALQYPRYSQHFFEACEKSSKALALTSLCSRSETPGFRRQLTVTEISPVLLVNVFHD